MGDMEELKKRLEKEQREIRIRKFTKNKASVFGLVVVTVMILLAVLAPLICRYDPLALDVKSRLQGCSADHWFGTDTMGRDVFARVLYGARISYGWFYRRNYRGNCRNYHRTLCKHQ